MAKKITAEITVIKTVTYTQTVEFTDAEYNELLGARNHSEDIFHNKVLDKFSEDESEADVDIELDDIEFFDGDD